ncbi:Thiamine-monophosphate kinase [Planktothrix tepida]|uniref:Thiamine-monophosphate kinase n=1 Tax=Planktothrix tepida PCC 9214 TaxID=671072 RepID=A0A1J1LQ02_9CYAN|nr:thiamine-phosphate kinase [Planktothrix tepida]CAD5980483.1 Thiamine-monophosphate kinase [Planktothrix tepida]CUR33641.1 Thiamine-monophosphate kinase [Planktothrix tepida PCC 9214]
MLVKEIGEQGLLAIVQRFCPPEMVGDDAAILSVPRDESLVITTDMLVDNVHFSDRTTSPFDVGWRSATVNLSDLAAMGAFPLGITVALGITGDQPVAWVEQLYQGLTTCLNQYNTPIMGGDICRSSVTCISITAFGSVNPDLAIKRSVARPGDVIVVTGYHGDSRGGLELLLHPELQTQLTANQRLSLIQAHQRPQPRLDVLPKLQTLLASQPSTAIAGMDSSDGLADAIVQICRASQVGAQVQRCQIPISEALQTLLPPQQALEWPLYGGEDFQLVLCLPGDLAQLLVQQLGTAASIIGEITSHPNILLIDDAEPSTVEELSLSRGFQHFLS